jgi:hypothetical protein
MAPAWPELRGPLYHGSTQVVREVDLAFSHPAKDFGRGFYATTSRPQAECLVFQEAYRVPV